MKSLFNLMNIIIDISIKNAMVFASSKIEMSTESIPPRNAYRYFKRTIHQDLKTKYFSESFWHLSCRFKTMRPRHFLCKGVALSQSLVKFSAANEGAVVVPKRFIICLMQFLLKVKNFDDFRQLRS